MELYVDQSGASTAVHVGLDPQFLPLAYLHFFDGGQCDHCDEDHPPYISMRVRTFSDTEHNEQGVPVIREEVIVWGEPRFMALVIASAHRQLAKWAPDLLASAMDFLEANPGWAEGHEPDCEDHGDGTMPVPPGEIDADLENLVSAPDEGDDG